jgi:hypothetical protein
VPVKAEARTRVRTVARATNGWFHQTARVGQVQLVGFALACGSSGDLRNTAVYSLAQPASRALDWQVARSPDPLTSATLSASTVSGQPGTTRPDRP